MTGGYSGLIPEMRGQEAVYGAVRTAFRERDKRKLYEALHLITDKDRECYYDKYPDCLPQLFDFMGRLSLEGGDPAYGARLLGAINKEKSASLSGWYAKVNFFTSIANIGEAL